MWPLSNASYLTTLGSSVFREPNLPYDRGYPLYLCLHLRYPFSGNTSSRKRQGQPCNICTATRGSTSIETGGYGFAAFGCNPNRVRGVARDHRYFYSTHEEVPDLLFLGARKDEPWYEVGLRTLQFGLVNVCGHRVDFTILGCIRRLSCSNIGQH